MEDLLLDTPVCFPPFETEGEWPPVPDWTDAHWRRWLTGHNAYAFLRQWTEEEVTAYLDIDRYRYGVGITPRGGKTKWFYLPTPIAVPFHACKIPNLLFGGAAGGSKSHSARWDAIKHGLAIPRFRAILMRRTFEELRRNHIDNLTAEIEQINAFVGEEILRYLRADHELWIAAHGKGQDSKIIFGHCQNVGDEEKYLGDAYDAFYPDEMATFEKKQIIGVAGRLRSEKRGIVPRMAGTSNPGGAHTLWLKDYFIDKREEVIRLENPRYRAEKYQFLGAMLYDNPYYMDPDGTYQTYEDRLFAYDSERRRQLLLGDWSALAGQFFPEFSPSVHVADLPIPPGCKVERWIDWGYDPHYGVCNWAVVFPNGRLYVFYEWRFNGAQAKQKLVASEVAKRIRSLTADEVLPLCKSTRITRSLADPSMWAGDGHSGEDYAETFKKNGVHLTKADNERVMGWGRVRHWLRAAPDGLPWIMFHPRCETTIRTLPGLIRDKGDPDDVNTDGEDHAGDTVRYGVMGRPTPSVMKMSHTVLPETMREELNKILGPSTGTRSPGMVA